MGRAKGGASNGGAFKEISELVSEVSGGGMADESGIWVL